MNCFQLSEENSDNELFVDFLKLTKNSKNSNKKVKHEKEYLIIQLSESHALIDTLKNNLREFEKDLLNKFSSDNLKSMLCIHSDNSNMLGIIVDDLDASTLHASDSELNSPFIKPVIVDTTFLDSSKNSYLNNCVKHRSKDSVTQAHGKFVPSCHNCGKVGHIRPNCFLIKTHRWKGKCKFCWIHSVDKITIM